MNASMIERVVFVVFILIALGLRVGEMWRKQGSERGAVSMLWSFYALVGAAGLVYAGSVLEFFFVPRPYWPAVGVAGMMLYAASVFLRRAAIRALGRFWSLHIEIRAQQPLVRTGPYRHVRHPAYAAFLLETVGVALAGNAWWSVALALVVYLPLLCWRIRREEAALVEKLGEPYRAYQREAWALLPGRSWGSGKGAAGLAS
jgi:protein-S-isoprenylcysteine O-methyltransferase Ste14